MRALLCGALLSTREQVQSGSINLQLLFGDVPSHMAFMSSCAFHPPLRARVCVQEMCNTCRFAPCSATDTPLKMLACIGSHAENIK